MISVLCLEDNLDAQFELRSLVDEGALPEQVEFIAVADVIAAKKLVLERRFDIAIVDVQVPLRPDEPPRRDGGTQFIDFVLTNPRAARPRYVIGVTAEKEIFEESKATFLRSLFALIERDPAHVEWRDALRKCIAYVVGQERDDVGVRARFGIDPVALLIVCALPRTELGAVRQWLCESWSEIQVPGDPAHYLSGNFTAASGRHQIIAVSAPEQGMPASAALVARAIEMFRPRFVAMTGIAAAIEPSTGFGDVLIASQTWDHTTGKIKSRGGEAVEILPESRPIKADPVLLDQMGRLGRDFAYLASLKSRWPAASPTSELRVHIGPLASGGAVIESASSRKGIVNRDRKTVGIDMEAHGVATACWYAPRPNPHFIIAKAVVDHAKPPKRDQWHSYAAYTATGVLAEWGRRFL